MPRAAKNKNNVEYLSNGITLTPAVPTAGDSVKIVYDGLLAKSGATHLYAHVGYGSNWTCASDYKMLKTEMGFEATIPVTNTDTLNVCFKDCAENWDNNSGRDYSFDVTQ